MDIPICMPDPIGEDWADSTDSLDMGIGGNPSLRGYDSQYY